MKLWLWLIFTIGNVALARDLSSTTDFPEVPPPASAYIQVIRIDPAQPEILYAASPGGGLFRSLNEGDSWQSINPNEQLRHFNAVVIDPKHPAQIYAGGEKTGLWVSLDRGNHWELAGLVQASIQDIAIDPHDSGRLFVLTSTGVYRTTDGTKGEWQCVFDYVDFIEREYTGHWPEETVRFYRFQGISIDPHNPSTVMFGGRWEGGYHRSDDGGDTWQHEQLSPIFRRADRLHFDPVDPNVYYAATHHQGLLKSYNRGKTWVSTGRGIEPQKRTPYYGAVLICGLAFDPAQPSTLYAGSDYSNWKSTDNGETWQEVGTGLTCEFTRSFAVGPESSGIIYAETNVGIYRSRDGGETWESCNRGLPEREILASTTGTFAGEKFEFAIVKGRPSVFRRSLTRGTDWVSISWLLYEQAETLRFDEVSKTLVIATEHGERRSFDGGLRWDVPATEYATRNTAHPTESVKLSAPSGHRAFSVVIKGAVIPDDSVVDEFYQRPPYVALALTESEYPKDGSEPLWTGSWDRALSGTIVIPEKLGQLAKPLILHVEVRDFQWGTRMGKARLRTEPEGVTTVQVDQLQQYSYFGSTR